MSGALLPFDAWREEMQAELAEAQQALATSTAELRAAEASFDAAKAQHEALREATAPLRSPAYAIAARLRHADEDLHDLGNAVARARVAVTSGRERCADLEEALRQVAQLSAPAAEDAATEEPAHA